MPCGRPVPAGRSAKVPTSGVTLYATEINRADIGRRVMIDVHILCFARNCLLVRVFRAILERRSVLESERGSACVTRETRKQIEFLAQRGVVGLRLVR